jgi:murein DD-endopeptidase MepM/ murein hydrolase activator NlpD
MIENKQLYPYNAAAEPTETSSCETDVAETEKLRAKFDQFLMRGLVCILTFLIIVFISQSQLEWVRWAKPYLHIAICATSRQTFGRFVESPLVAEVLAQSRNLIRPEYFTRKLLKEPAATVQSSSLEQWVWPVRGRLIKKFGWSSTSGNRSVFSSGIEISAPPGEKIIAACAGTVQSVTRTPATVWSVVIDHGDALKTVYQNLGYVYVESGQFVYTGAPIAKMKLSGKAGDSTLHFELWEAGKPVDPLNWFIIR